MNFQTVVARQINLASIVDRKWILYTYSYWKFNSQRHSGSLRY